MSIRARLLVLALCLLVAGGVAVGAVVALRIVFGSAATAPSQPQLTVINLDGPDVEVTFWNGAAPMAVGCDSEEVDPDILPSPVPQSWNVVVTSQASGEVLFRQRETGDRIVVLVQGERCVCVALRVHRRLTRLMPGAGAGLAGNVPIGVKGLQLQWQSGARSGYS